MEELDFIEEDVQNVAESIRDSYKSPVVEKYNGSQSSGLDDLIQKASSSKKGLQEYSDLKFTDVYERLNSGDYVAKYPNISTVDLNQEERLAQQQDTSNKWSNGLKKFLGKVGTGILGGTIGAVDGIVNFAQEGTLESTYNSDFNKWLDDLNTKMDFKMPNYYSQAEKDKSLFAQMGTANFWANDVLGGAAFTVSAIGSEALWAAATGGTSLATSLARLGAKTAGLYSKGSKALKTLGAVKNSSKPPLRFFQKAGDVTDKVIDRTVLFGKAGQLANTARFTYTSAGYEAGFEARHFMNEQIDKFEEDFETLNGRPPTMEDREKFHKDLTSAANNLFSFNMALVGGSNLAIFGKAFGIKSPFKLPKKYVNSKIFGIGNKTARKGEGQIEKVTANKLQKFVRSSYSLGKAGITEGLIEEGGQGMGGSTAGAWVTSGYDSDNYKAQLDMAEAMSDGFSEAYGTKEGQKEVLIGTLIGIITGTGVNLTQGKGLFGDMKDLQRKANQEYAYRKEYTPDKVLSNIQKGARAAKAVENIELAEEAGDTVGAEVERKKLLLSHITEANNFDFSEEAKKDFFEAINRMEDKDIQEQFGLDSIEDAKEYKSNILQEYSSIEAKYKKYREFTEYFLADVAKKEGLSAANTDVLKEAIAVELTLGEDMNEHSGNLLQMIKEELTQGMYNTKAESINRALAVEDILSSASKETRQKFRETRDKVKKAKRRLEELDKKRLEQNKKKPAEQLNTVVGEIEELQSQLRILEAENEAQLSAMVLENPFRNQDEEFITSEDLDNIEKELKYVGELMETYKGANPQKYAKLNILLRDYATVKEGLKKHSELNRQLSDPSLGLRGKRNLIKELMLDKEPNQITLELLKTVQDRTDEILKNRADYQADAEKGIENVADLTPEEIKEFEDKGEVTDIVVKKIAKKRKNNKDLTEQETQIYNKFKERVDQAEVDLGKTSMETPDEKAPQEDKRTSIQKIIDDNKYLVNYLGTEDNAKMPTPEELEEYKELLAAVKKDRKLPLNKVVRVAANYFAKRGTKVSLTPTQLQRFKDLNQKVQDFQLYKHYENEEGISLAELIAQQVSLEQEASDKEPVKKELTEDDNIQLINTDENPDEPAGKRDGSIIQTYEGAKVRKEKEWYMFSHLKLFTFLSRMPGLKSIKVQEPTSYDKDGKPKYGKAKSVDLQDIPKYEGLPDVKVTAVAGDKKVQLTTQSRARIGVKSSELDLLLELTGFKVYKNALLKGNTFSDVYEINEDGSETQKGNEFEMQDESGQFKGYTPQQAFEIEKGDKLEFTLNREDRWNKAWRKKFLEGKITKQKLTEMVKVYVVGKGDVVLGDLKSAENLKNGTDNFMKIRKAATDALLASTTKNSPTAVRLPFRAPMAFTFLGTPVLKVENGKPVEQDFTDEMLEEVEDFGVIENGKLKLKNNSKSVRKDFVSKLNNAPVIVIRKGKYLIAYPVSLKRTESAKSSEFAAIMGNRGNLTKKATEINNLLAENGIKPNLFFNSIEDQNMVNEDGSMSENLMKAEEALNEKAKYVDPITWTEKEFTKEMLKDQAKTSIDLTGKKFISPKPVLNLTGNIGTNPNQGPNKVTSTGQFNDDTMEDAKKEEDTPCPEKD